MIGKDETDESVDGSSFSSLHRSLKMNPSMVIEEEVVEDLKGGLGLKREG